MSAETLSYESRPPDAPGHSPVVELLALAIPTVAQMAAYTVQQFADTYMLARVGDVQATAAAQSGMLSFSLISFGMGVLFVINTLVSQSFGRKDFASCGRYLWQGVWFGIVFGLVVAPLLVVAGPLFRGLGHSPKMAAFEATFFQITVAAAAIKLAAVSVGQFLLAINRPTAVLFGAIGAVATTIFFNWVLIYGHLGFPPMGVAGSAISTNLGVLAELTILVLIARRPQIVEQFNLRAWQPSKRLLATLLRLGVPAGGQVVAEVLAWTMFTVWVMAQFNEPAEAANVYTFRFMSVSFMPVYGMSVAVTALVGRYIGMGRPDVAARRAHLGFLVGGLYSLSCGVGFYFFRYSAMRLFTEDPAILQAGAVLMTFAAVYLVFDTMYIIYNGGLRGAGDTFVPAVAIAGLCWTITVFGGYAVARVKPGWGVAGPWSVALTYGIILGFFMLARFLRGKWKLIRIEKPDAPIRQDDALDQSPILPDAHGATA